MRMTIEEKNGKETIIELINGQYKRGVKLVDGVRRRYVNISCICTPELDDILDIDLRTSKVTLFNDNVQFDPSTHEMVDLDVYESNMSTLIGGIKDETGKNMFFNIVFDLIPKVVAAVGE